MTIQLDLQGAAAAVQGRLTGENAAFIGVSTDTRSVRAGELFIALRGEKYDAHEFLATARERGAAAALVAEDALAQPAVAARWQAAKGGAPAQQEMMGGQVQVMMALVPEAMPIVKSGKLRALAVTSSKRLPAYPDVPTVAEAGVPGYEFASWHGVFVPAGTPPAVVERLNAELNKIVADPVVRERMAALNIELVGGTPAAFGDFIKAEAGKITELVRISGAKAN